MFWVMHSGIIAAIGNVFGRYVGHFFTLTEFQTRLVGAGAIVVLSAVNYVGVRHGSAVQTFFTGVKLVAVLAIIAAGAWFLVANGAAVSAPPIAGSQVTLSAFATATAAGLFAYGGWHMVTYAAEETKDATRTIPRALFIGTTIVTVAYIGVNAAYLAVLPLETVTKSTRVAADFADAVAGSAAGGQALSVLVILSTLGAMTGIIRAGSYRALFTRVIYTEWIFFAAVAGSLFFLRRRADYTPSYRLWGFPVLPGIFVLSSLGIVAHEIIKDPVSSLSGLGLVAAGLPVYWIWMRFTKNRSS
jgi:APA family basic amino acid/polyamine antiporter